HFFYFGREAPIIPSDFLDAIGYKNGINYRVFADDQCADIINWLHRSYRDELNYIKADPFDFDISEKRYSVGNNKISETIASLPGFGMVPEWHLFYSSGPNMR